MRRLSAEQEASLRASFDQQLSAATAAKAAGCSLCAALDRYHKFNRGPLRPFTRMYGAPVYDGPDWIGKPVDSA